MSKAKHCDECRHATVKWYLYRGPPAFDVLKCAKGHKPRFYMPRNDNPLDLNYDGSGHVRISRQLTLR